MSANITFRENYKAYCTYLNSRYFRQSRVHHFRKKRWRLGFPQLALAVHKLNERHVRGVAASRLRELENSRVSAIAESFMYLVYHYIKGGELINKGRGEPVARSKNIK